MTLQFTTNQIAFALATTFDELSLALKFQIQTKLKANSTPDAVHSIEITPDALLFVYKRCTQLPEGYSAAPNKQLKDALLPQIAALAGQGDEEALQVVAALQEMDAADQAKRAEMITSSIDRILTA